MYYKIISIDVGLTGGISVFDGRTKSLLSTVPMPVRTIVLKEARYKFRDKDPKVVFKSGKKKGQRPTKILSKQKVQVLLDVDAIVALIRKYRTKGSGKRGRIHIAIEKQQPMPRQNNTSHLINYGRMLAICEYLAKGRVTEVVPSVWKRSLALIFVKKNKGDKKTPADVAELKAKSLALAKSCYPHIDFQESHDLAESALIGKYFLANFT